MSSIITAPQTKATYKAEHKVNLTEAHDQWASRPADQRYWTLGELHAATKWHRDNAIASKALTKDLRLSAGPDNSLVLYGKSDYPSALTNYAFGQLARRAGAPPAYLRTLPAELAAQNVNHGLKRIDGDAALLFQRTPNNTLELRAALTDAYTRIWDCDIVDRVMGLGKGWRVPPARPALANQPGTRRATAEDCVRASTLGQLAIRPGDSIAPAGLYASDRDVFIFMVNEDVLIPNPADPNTPLARGFFLWNSEVGDRAFGLKTFLYDAVCGNHIVWGAQDVKEARVVHVGSAENKAWSSMRVTISQYANASAVEDGKRIAKTQSYVLGGTKDDVLKTLFSYIDRKSLALSKANVTEAYDVAERTPRYGNPHTPWAIAQGITEISQRSVNTDKRDEMDRAAGKILEIAF